MRVMASYRPKIGKWVARRKRGTIEFCLGHFNTQGEALRAEQEFDLTWPPEPTGRRHGVNFNGKRVNPYGKWVRNG